MAQEIKERGLPNFTPFEIIGRKKREQKKINISGIEIYFPYNIYPNQKKYMEKIIELLNNNIKRENYTNIAALESPTGTGKTLCLLCSTLAWMNEMRKQKKFGGKILYTTRTHSQISQIIRELQKTCYWPKTAVLASRDICCINSKIRKNTSGAILNIRCRKFNGNCSYYNGVLTDKREQNNCLDIESLCVNGKKQIFCPFFQQIESAKTYSDITFMPYNYVFDEKINKILGIDIENNILIIDEAHNLRQVCEDSKSVEIKDNDFDDIINDLVQLLNYDDKEETMINLLSKKEKERSPLVEISKESIQYEINIITSIKNKFDSPKIKIDEGGKKLSFSEFFEIFISKEPKNKKRKKKVIYRDESLDSNMPFISDIISISNIKDHIEFLNKVEKAFEEFYERGSKISILLKIFSIISILAENIYLQNSYNFLMENEEIIQTNKESNNINEITKIRKFNILCFNPQIQFSDILKRNPYSIILTSGTLTPFKIFEDELQIKFNITLENQHIVPIDQFKFDIITNYSETGKYRFDYNNRNSIEMINALGYEIYNNCKKTPYGGILVFFPSYFYLNKCQTQWNEVGLFKKIGEYKKIYVDSAKDKNLISEIKKNFNKNYIFFSVFRGSSSEGIDFSDDCARMVICVGIPFANLIERRIKLKIEYLNNRNKKDKNFIGGNEWYLIDAMTAVNQSLGRVIRHINDYGVMICIDERYKNFEKYFSFWIREHYEKYKNKINSNINQFFNEQRQKFKNIKSNGRERNIDINSNKSGFNSIITFDKNKLNKLNNIINEEEKKMDDINLPEEIEIVSLDENDSDYHLFENINKNTQMKEGLTIFFELTKIDNEKTSDEYQTNYIEEFNIKEDKKNNEKELNFSFEKYENEGKELIESLNEFISNNPKQLNEILNKYKYS